MMHGFMNIKFYLVPHLLQYMMISLHNFEFSGMFELVHDPPPTTVSPIRLNTVTLLPFHFYASAPEMLHFQDPVLLQWR